MSFSGIGSPASKGIPPEVFAGRTMLDSHSPCISGDGRFIVFVTEEDTGDSISCCMSSIPLQSEGPCHFSVYRPDSHRA